MFQGTMQGAMQRPGTMFRPGSTAGGPPGTGQRLGTGMAGAGASLGANVDVQTRSAVQREGMKSVPSRAGVSTSHGRQVGDRSYYIGLLRPKVTELTAEIERLRQQEDQIGRNSGVLVELQQKQKALTEEIGKLKTTLVSMNFAVEQSTSGDVENISAQGQTLKQKNAEDRRAVDKMFLAVKESQTQTKKLQGDLDNEMQKIDERMQRADQRTAQQYQETRAEAYRVSDQVLNMQQEIRSLETKHDMLMVQLGADPDKKQAAQLMLDILKKRSNRDEMAKECSISIEEERKVLTDQVRNLSEDIAVLGRQVVEARDAAQNTRTRVSQLDEELAEYSGDNARKFQELQEKEREMKEFMDTFNDNEKEEMKNVQELERVIQELLERISRALTIKAQLPAENAPIRVGELNDEVKTKEEQIEIARKTFERLQKQLQERKDELAKVAELDARIAEEIEALQEKVKEQTEEKAKFSDLDGLRTEMEARKDHLTMTRTDLSRQRDSAKQHIHMLSQQYETLRQQLTDDKIHESLVAQETRLRTMWQSTFAIEDFVRQREKETQYQGTKSECLRLVDDINGMLLDNKQRTTLVGDPASPASGEGGGNNVFVVGK